MTMTLSTNTVEWSTTNAPITGDFCSSEYLLPPPNGHNTPLDWLSYTERTLLPLAEKALLAHAISVFYENTVTGEYAVINTVDANQFNFRGCIQRRKHIEADAHVMNDSLIYERTNHHHQLHPTYLVNTVFLTLTDGYRRWSLNDTVRAMVERKRQFKLFGDKLRRKFGKYNALRVCECHEGGGCHIHAVVQFDKALVAKQRLTRMADGWKTDVVLNEADTALMKSLWRSVQNHPSDTKDGLDVEVCTSCSEVGSYIAKEVAKANDCEGAVRRMRVLIQHAHDWLQAGVSIDKVNYAIFTEVKHGDWNRVWLMASVTQYKFLTGKRSFEIYRPTQGVRALAKQLGYIEPKRGEAKEADKLAVEVDKSAEIMANEALSDICGGAEFPAEVSVSTEMVEPALGIYRDECGQVEAVSVSQSHPQPPPDTIAPDRHKATYTEIVFSPEWRQVTSFEWSTNAQIRNGLRVEGGVITDRKRVGRYVEALGNELNRKSATDADHVNKLALRALQQAVTPLF